MAPRFLLWAQASQVIQSYGSSLSAYGLFLLGAHFVWVFRLMFLFSGRGYWQELIESIVWAHNKLKVAPATQPRALSIVQGRALPFFFFLLWTPILAIERSILAIEWIWALGLKILEKIP